MGMLRLCGKVSCRASSKHHTLREAYMLLGDLNTEDHHPCVSRLMVLGEAGNVTLSLLSQSGMFHDLDLITQEMTHP